MSREADLKNPKQQLAELLKADEPPKILLVTAKDSVRRSRSINQLKNKFFSNPSVAVHRLDATQWDSESRAELIRLLNSPGLFSPVTLVELDCVDALSKSEHLSELVECLQYASEQTSLWLSSAPLPKSNKLRKACEKLGVSLEFPELAGTTLKSWIKKEAQQLDLLEPSDQLLNAIAHVAEDSLDQITAVVEHISLYSSDGKISYSEFSELYPDAPEENEFALLDLIHFGQPALIEAKLTKFFQEGKNSFMFLGLLVRTYSKYVSLRSLLDSGMAHIQAREALTLKEWTFKKHLEVVSKKSLKRLYRDLEALLRADSKLKNRSLGETEIFCELASQLTVLSA